jgi:hypothetical protein
MSLRTCILAAAALAAGPALGSASSPTDILIRLPRLPEASALSCQAIAPAVEQIERETRTASEQAELIALRPRGGGGDTPGEIGALLENPAVTMCISEFGESDWLMDLDFSLDSTLSGLREERGKRADNCPQKGGFPEPKCLAKLDAELETRAKAAVEAYLKDAQAGLDAEAQRMANCTRRRDDAAGAATTRPAGCSKPAATTFRRSA